MDIESMPVVYRKEILCTAETHPLPCSSMAKKRKTGHPKKKKTGHHRKPRSTGGSNDRENISWVTDHEHRAYHMLFDNKPPREVARILTKRWIDPEWVLIAQKKRGYRRRKRAMFQY